MKTRRLASWVGAATALYGAPAALGIPGLTHRISPGGRSPGRPGGVIALTFDDGPHRDGTPAVLDVLAEYRCTATFFIIGEQLARRPDLVRRIHEGGHELAVHGWTHRCTLLSPPAEIHRDIGRTVALIADLTGQSPTRYRPPYGVASTPALLAARHARLAPAWWTAWGRDWEPNATAAGVSQLVTRQLPRARRPVVLLHDSDTYGTTGSWRTTAGATRRLCRAWQEQGAKAVSLDEVCP
jgi:peptidoglycan/xylan/chitin deacetylase (PgdA/CDA1 family)